MYLCGAQPRSIPAASCFRSGGPACRGGPGNPAPAACAARRHRTRPGEARPAPAFGNAGFGAWPAGPPRAARWATARRGLHCSADNRTKERRGRHLAASSSKTLAQGAILVFSRRFYRLSTWFCRSSEPPDPTGRDRGHSALATFPPSRKKKAPTFHLPATAQPMTDYHNSTNEKP